MFWNLNSLYPKIKNIINKENITVNKGNVYEVYQNLRYSGFADHPPGPKNPQELNEEDIVLKYMEIRKGTQSFVSGGDYELTQFKLLSASPSIASLNTISKALKIILGYIKQGQNSFISIENIKKNVFSKEFDILSKDMVNNIINDVDNEITTLLTWQNKNFLIYYN